jgi:hypothetical protein
MGGRIQKGETMNPYKQRIAIAYACGWRIDPDSGIKHLPFTVHDPSGDFYHAQSLDHAINFLPDYLADLNAMHEAWLTLSDADKYVFAEFLQRVVFKGGGGDGWVYWPSNATAAQRAEVFLRTKGKWEDEA